MTALQITLNLLSYACFSLGTLLVWPSRRNVIAWLGFPFFVVAYLIPLLAVDYASAATPEVIAELTAINAAGALAMAMGIVLGGHFGMKISVKLPFRLAGPPASTGLSPRRAFKILIVGCVLMTLCFLWMRSVPAFADEPFLAKFFRGQYKARYDQVSIPYRFSQIMLTAALPLALVFLAEMRDRALLVPVVWAVVLFALALNRGTALAGMVLMVAAWASRTRLRMTWFLLVSTFVFCVGSGVYFIIGLVVSADFNVWDEIARGAPDVKDQLGFLRAFDPSTQLTYGLTFIGGLVPSNFTYNPSVYTLTIANDVADVSDVASGGLRLPASIAGYMAFGWTGAILVSLVSGFLTGHFTKKLRVMPTRNFSQQIATLLWFQIYASFWILFYEMSYQGVISIFLFSYLIPDMAALGRMKPATARLLPRWRWCRRRATRAGVRARQVGTP